MEKTATKLEIMYILRWDVETVRLQVFRFLEKFAKQTLLKLCLHTYSCRMDVENASVELGCTEAARLTPEHLFLQLLSCTVILSQEHSRWSTVD